MSQGESSFDKINAFIGGLVFSFAVLVIVDVCFGGICWLKEWQTLVTGVFAAFAGFLAFFGLQRQIAIQLELEAARLKKKNLTDRARLAQPLSNLIAVCQSSIKKISVSMEADGPYLVSQGPLIEFDFGNFEELGSSDLALITEAIHSADEERADDLSLLVADLQILNANLNSKTGRDSIESHGKATLGNAYSYLWRTVLIYARAQRLLYYARRQDTDLNGLSLKNSARVVVFSNHLDGISEKLTQYIEQRISNLL